MAHISTRIKSNKPTLCPHLTHLTSSAGLGSLSATPSARSHNSPSRFPTCRSQLHPKRLASARKGTPCRSHHNPKIKTSASSVGIRRFLPREPVLVHAHTHAAQNAFKKFDRMGRISVHSVARAGMFGHDPSNDHQSLLHHQKRNRSNIRIRRRSVQCSRPSFSRSY